MDDTDDTDGTTLGADAAESAGWHLAREVPTFVPGTTAGAARAAIAGRRFDCVDLVLVVDAWRRVVGVLTVGQLLALDPAATLDGAMLREFPVVRGHIDQEHVASAALEHGLTAIPVVDDAGGLVGVVPAAALLEILRREHVEDLHRLAGIARETEFARDAIEAPPVRRMRHRLPWLLVGLGGSVLASLVMAQFEQVLAANLAVAFFVPGIVYLADAIGTQTETIAVRGLSLSRVRFGQLLGGEIRTGLLIGLVLGLATFAGVGLAMGDLRLAAAVALALFVAGGLATAIGLALPSLLHRLGRDPAYGSGPLATIIQDVLSLAVYLMTVTFIMQR
jgi:magnesium transporter